MLSSIIKTALLLAGVAQADFVMMRYLAARDSTRGKGVHESFYFANLTNDQVATGGRPDKCEIGALYPRVGGVAHWEGESNPYIIGVAVDGGYKDVALSKPKRVEVYWGRDEGHWTLYGVPHGGLAPYDMVDLRDQKKGNCTMEFKKEEPTGCRDADGTIAQVWPFALCKSSSIHPPMEHFAARDPAANTAI